MQACYPRANTAPIYIFTLLSEFVQIKTLILIVDVNPTKLKDWLLSRKTPLLSTHPSSAWEPQMLIKNVAHQSPHVIKLWLEASKGILPGNYGWRQARAYSLETMVGSKQGHIPCKPWLKASKGMLPVNHGWRQGNAHHKLWLELSKGMLPANNGWRQKRAYSH